MPFSAVTLIGTKCHILSFGKHLVFDLSSKLELESTKKSIGAITRSIEATKRSIEEKKRSIEATKRSIEATKRSIESIKSTNVITSADSEKKETAIDMAVTQDLIGIQGKIDDLISTSDEMKLSEYFDIIDKIHLKTKSLAQNIKEKEEKSKAEETTSNLEMKQIDESLQKLLVKKAKLREKLDKLQEKIKRYQEQSDQCDEIKAKQLKIFNSKKFVQKWDQLEKKWKEWDCKEMVFWFDKILREMAPHQLKVQKQMMIKINGQVDETPRGNNNDEEDSKNDDDNDGRNSVDWSVVSNNLSRREISGKFLLICDDKELIKLGFENDKDRTLLLKNIKMLTNKYQDKSIVRNESPKKVCCICLSNKINTICIPCGHACMCKKCSGEYDKTNACPICRKEIQNIFDMFIS